MSPTAGSATFALQPTGAPVITADGHIDASGLLDQVPELSDAEIPGHLARRSYIAIAPAEPRGASGEIIIGAHTLDLSPVWARQPGNQRANL